MNQNRYHNLPSRQFWRTAVVEDHILTTTSLWRKKFTIDAADRIASAGSCFAQHISRRLSQSGYNFLDLEPAPSALPRSAHGKYGYSTYSARYGNIYTTGQLVELAEECLGMRKGLDYSWKKGDRFVDPLRPSVEPEGLDSHEQVLAHRRYHLSRVRNLLETSDVFVFTLGLTETWVCRRSGRALPVAPGVLGGEDDPNLYQFKNYTHNEIKRDLLQFMNLVWSLQSGKKCRFLLTVSPVPLTATATDQHVLVATTHSKSTLRSVAGELYQEHDLVDYFPSYEIIISPWSRGLFFEPNMRNVTTAGVESVMRVFFNEHRSMENEVHSNVWVDQSADARQHTEREDGVSTNESIICEDALLEAFGK